MTMLRRIVPGEVTNLGEDEVEVILATSDIARDGHILVAAGVDLSNFRQNPVVLWQHSPDEPVGRCEDVAIVGDKIIGKVRFAPPGISQKADEIRGLTKAGVIRAVSVGFDPIEMEPLDPKKPRAGQRIGKWDLLELSFVSVPSDTGAIVTNRAHGDDEMTDITGGDAVAAPEQKPTTRAKTAMNRAVGVTFTRGLYQVASLCYLLLDLGRQIDITKWEAEIEGDGSKVPAMLAACLGDLGDALLAMTAEEVAELLAGHGIELSGEDDDTDVVLLVEEREHIAAATTPAVRAFRRGLAHAKLRVGKTLSTDTVQCLRAAKSLHEDAIGLHRTALRKHSDALGAIDDLMDRSGVSDVEPASPPAAETTETDEAEVVPEGERMSADFRRRQADLMAFSAT
ncbi:hypothetical protein BH10PSE14_BH10PSE14_06650 [soil metagenome]